VFSVLDKYERSSFISNDDVDFSVTGDITRCDLRADSRAVVDQMWNEVYFAIGFTIRFEPVKYGRVVSTWVIAVMSPESFAGDNVEDTIPVDVR